MRFIFFSDFRTFMGERLKQFPNTVDSVMFNSILSFLLFVCVCCLFMRMSRSFHQFLFSFHLILNYLNNLWCRAGLVIVYWIAVSALHSSAVPSEEQDPRDLVPMTYFTHTNWQIGDRAILPQTSKVSAADAGGISSAASEVGALDVRNGESSSLEGSSENIGHNAVELTGSTEGVVDEVAEETADEVAASKQRKIGKLRKVSRKEKKASRKDKHLEKAALVVNTRTSVDILWQDGSKSSKVDSCSLVPIEHVGDHDFWPEQYVLEQGPDGDDLDNEVRRVGERLFLFEFCFCLYVALKLLLVYAKQVAYSVGI